jgi:hypothetical protein
VLKTGITTRDEGHRGPTPDLVKDRIAVADGKGVVELNPAAIRWLEHTREYSINEDSKTLIGARDNPLRRIRARC